MKRKQAESKPKNSKCEAVKHGTGETWWRYCSVMAWACVAASGTESLLMRELMRAAAE